jgi:hypothetical protein
VINTIKQLCFIDLFICFQHFVTEMDRDRYLPDIEFFSHSLRQACIGIRDDRV